MYISLRLNFIKFGTWQKLKLNLEILLGDSDWILAQFVQVRNINEVRYCCDKWEMTTIHYKCDFVWKVHRSCSLNFYKSYSKSNEIFSSKIFQIIDSNNNSTNIAKINNSLAIILFDRYRMVIDSHLSTRTSNKRTNAFSLSYVNGWKKIRRWICFDVFVKKKKYTHTI